MTRSKIAGFTLVELIIVITIVGVITAAALPSYMDTVERKRLQEAAESLKSDMMFAKTETIKRSENLRVDLVKTGSTWCYGINDDNTACACGTPGDCVIKAIASTNFDGVALDASDNTTFSFRRGTATSMDAILSSSNYQVKIKVSNRGRVLACTPVGTTGLFGYEDC